MGAQPRQEQTLIEKLTALTPLLLPGLQAEGVESSFSYGDGAKAADREEC